MKGLLSTIVNKIDDEEIPATHTTPDPLQLNALLNRMVEAGCEYAFIEVSSHSVVQHRIGGLTFAGGIFSNLTHDHLDFHNMQQESRPDEKATLEQSEDRKRPNWFSRIMGGEVLQSRAVLKQVPLVVMLCFYAILLVYNRYRVEDLTKERAFSSRALTGR